VRAGVYASNGVVTPFPRTRERNWTGKFCAKRNSEGPCRQRQSRNSAATRHRTSFPPANVHGPHNGQTSPISLRTAAQLVAKNAVKDEFFAFRCMAPLITFDQSADVSGTVPAGGSCRINILTILRLTAIASAATLVSGHILVLSPQNHSTDSCSHVGTVVVPLRVDDIETQSSSRNRWLLSSRRRRLLIPVFFLLALPGSLWIGIAVVDAVRNRWTFSAAEAEAMQAEAGRRLGQPEEWTNSFGMKFRLIPAGLFSMGTNSWGWAEYLHDERPRHSVTIPGPFYMGAHEVTQSQWQQVMKTTPWKDMLSVIEGLDVAASCISWDDATAFCERLTACDGRRYRLPTEAEWEWACRAGTDTDYTFGERREKLSEYSWHSGNTEGQRQGYAHRVGRKLANAFGLFDTHGNVGEWCSDWYDASYYSVSPSHNPQGPSSGSLRVSRGGTWNGVPVGLRSSHRESSEPSNSNPTTGFRVVLEPLPNKDSAQR
jgi:formylglycine-generating enzyme required for sulfatase activity